MPNFKTVRTRVRGKLRFLLIETRKVGNKILTQTVKIVKSIKNSTRKIRKRIIIWVLVLLIGLGNYNHNLPDSPSSYFTTHTTQNQPQVSKVQEQKSIPMLQAGPPSDYYDNQKTSSEGFIRESANKAHETMEERRELSKRQKKVRVAAARKNISMKGGGQNDVTLFDQNLENSPLDVTFSGDGDPTGLEYIFSIIKYFSGEGVITEADAFSPQMRNNFLSNSQYPWLRQKPRSDLEKFLQGNQNQRNSYSIGTSLEVRRTNSDVNYTWSKKQTEKKAKHFKPNELNVTVAPNQTNFQARGAFLEKFIQNPNNTVLQGDFNVDRALKENDPSLAKTGFFVIDDVNSIVAFFEVLPSDINQFVSTTGNHSGNFRWIGWGPIPEAKFVTIYKSNPVKIATLWKTRRFQ